jgi:hypothetical protein
MGQALAELPGYLNPGPGCRAGQPLGVAEQQLGRAGQHPQRRQAAQDGQPAATPAGRRVGPSQGVGGHLTQATSTSSVSGWRWPAGRSRRGVSPGWVGPGRPWPPGGPGRCRSAAVSPGPGVAAPPSTSATVVGVASQQGSEGPNPRACSFLVLTRETLGTAPSRCSTSRLEQPIDLQGSIEFADASVDPGLSLHRCSSLARQEPDRHGDSLGTDDSSHDLRQ